MNVQVNINVCRVCMKPDEGASLLNDAEMRAKFEFTTRLKLHLHDNLPNIICSKCVTRLQVSHEFIQMAHATEQNLKTFLEKVSKDFEKVSKICPTVDKDTDKSEDEELLNLIFDDEVSVPIESKSLINEEQEHEAERRARITTPTPQSIACTKKQRNGNLSLSKKEKCSEENENVETFTAIVSTVPQFLTFKNEAMNELENMQESTKTQKSSVHPAQEEHEMEEDYVDDDTHTDLEMLDDNLQQNEESEFSENMHPSQHTDGFLKEYEATFSDEGDYLDDSSSMHEPANNELGSYETGGESVLPHPREPGILDDAELELESIVEAQNSANNTVEFSSTSCESKDIATGKYTTNQKLSKTRSKSCRNQTDANTRFYCFKCDRDFSTKTNLRRHMNTHEGNRPWKCIVCGKSFTQNGSLKQHMYTHTDEKPYVCKVCNRGFSQCKSLVFHMRRHTGEKPFSCEKCGAVFRQKDGLKSHIFKLHTYTEQRGNSEVHTCSICNKVLASNSSLNVHMKKHVNNHKSVADSSVTSSNQLIDEDNNGLFMDLIDEELLNEKPETCNAENDDDISSSAHLVDLTTTSASKPHRAKKFQCRICFKCFAIKRNFLRHLSTHDLACDYCSINFRSVEELRQHRINIHNSSVNELLQCEICLLVFTSSEELDDHKNFEHAFTCPKCPGANFETRSLLSRHFVQKHNIIP